MKLTKTSNYSKIIISIIITENKSTLIIIIIENKKEESNFINQVSIYIRTYNFWSKAESTIRFIIFFFLNGGILQVRVP